MISAADARELVVDGYDRYMVSRLHNHPAPGVQEELTGSAAKQRLRGVCPLNPCNTASPWSSKVLFDHVTPAFRAGELSVESFVRASGWGDLVPVPLYRFSGEFRVEFLQNTTLGDEVREGHLLRHDV